MSKPRRYWMMKSEPDAFGIDDLEGGLVIGVSAITVKG